jgi:hypothetical protein
VARAVKTVLTGNRAAPPSESDEFGAFVRRVIRAYARRVADRDIEALTGLAALRDEVDAAMREAVTGLHGNPYSWADIGRALGITRQAAQARFGQPSSSPRLTDV